MGGRLKGLPLTAHRWRVVLWLSATFGVLWVLFVARGALVPFVVGAVVGYALLPLVERTVAVLPIRDEGIRRGEPVSEPTVRRVPAARARRDASAARRLRTKPQRHGRLRSQRLGPTFRG